MMIEHKRDCYIAGTAVPVTVINDEGFQFIDLWWNDGDPILYTVLQNATIELFNKKEIDHAENGVDMMLCVDIYEEWWDRVKKI